MNNKLIDIVYLFKVFVKLRYYKYDLYLKIKPILIELIKENNVGLIKLKDLNLNDEDLKDFIYFIDDYKELI